MIYTPKLDDWTRNTGVMIGRYQPWNKGHSAMFKQIASYPGSRHRVDRNNPRQIIIMVKQIENPEYTFEEIVKQITTDLEPEYHGRYEIIQVPNVSNVFMGRQVGYDVERVNLKEEDEPVDNKKTLAAESDYFWMSTMRGRQ